MGEQLQADVIEEQGIKNMKEQVSPMIAERIRPPKHVVKPERSPRERLILAEMKGREHPPDFSPTKPTVTGVAD